MQNLLLLSQREETENVLVHRKRFVLQLCCVGGRNLFSSSTVIAGCQPKAQRQSQRCPLSVRVCTSLCVPACGEQGQVLQLGPCWGTQVTSPCALAGTSMCPVDVPVPGEPCGCLWLLVSLDGDALSLLCTSFSYICEPWLRQALCPCHALLGHRHLGML